MKKTLGTCAWTVAALLATGTGTVAQPAKDTKPAGVEETAGPRLRVRFLETRLLGDKTTTVQIALLTLHTGDKPANVFVGTQVALRTSDKGAPTVTFKNAGVQAEVRAQALPGSRYRLEASFERASVLAASGGAAAPSNGDNPVLQVVKGESRIVLREGETVPFASAVDPVTGEVVRVDIAVDAAPGPPSASAAGSEDARLRVRFVLNRRHGERKVASRPYTVIVQAGEEKPANVFSGAMLPLEVSYQGQPTVMLKDIGAGVRARRAAHRRRELPPRPVRQRRVARCHERLPPRAGVPGRVPALSAGGRDGGGRVGRGSADRRRRRGRGDDRSRPVGIRRIRPGPRARLSANRARLRLERDEGQALRREHLGAQAHGQGACRGDPRHALPGDVEDDPRRLELPADGLGPVAFRDQPLRFVAEGGRRPRSRRPAPAGGGTRRPARGAAAGGPRRARAPGSAARAGGVPGPRSPRPPGRPASRRRSSAATSALRGCGSGMPDLGARRERIVRFERTA